ncbi:hypothetical protein HDA32_001458 [Spinactinospora alkalitolerans]|uniref:Uncharacterized protein n=1 Tax=Spinactinospora alkalitolerans TaxID=687207 RepID=A0A852TQU9_9ACTN|nr:hypothetical protein [Spinactinospora alkalitolerans]NYE46338.1 hypothetical protein [Spinactinospora alkalitolerans]
MSEQPERVTARDVADFLSEVLGRFGGTSPETPAEDVAFFERKAALFDRVAAEHPDDAEAQDVAADVRRQLAEVRERCGLDGGEV